MLPLRWCTECLFWKRAFFIMWKFNSLTVVHNVNYITSLLYNNIFQKTKCTLFLCICYKSGFKLHLIQIGEKICVWFIRIMCIKWFAMLTTPNKKLFRKKKKKEVLLHTWREQNCRCHRHQRMLIIQRTERLLFLEGWACYTSLHFQ